MQNITLTPQIALVFGAVIELYRNKIDDPTDADIYDALGSVTLKLIGLQGIRKHYLLTVNDDKYFMNTCREVRVNLKQYTALRILQN